MNTFRNIFPSLFLIALVWVGAASADEVSPARGWVTLEHAPVVRTDKIGGIAYDVVTATVYGKRLPNGAALPELLILREKTAARCANEKCLYRYSAFELGRAETLEGTQQFSGKPIELPPSYTEHQQPADYVVDSIRLVTRTLKCGKRLWNLETTLKDEGLTLHFAGEAFAARPNPKFQLPGSR